MVGQGSQNLRDVKRRRQQDMLVGREEQISLFRENLRLLPDDARRKFVFAISGQGGVGKTTLLRRWWQLAQNASAAFAWIDEAQRDVPEVLSAIAEQLRQQGHICGAFEERYRVYRKHREELERDPKAPAGLAAMIGRTLGRAGVVFGRRAPVVGAVADFMDEEAAAQHAGEWAEYLASKVTNKDEMRLLQDPLEELFPLLLAELHSIGKQRGVALFFDTFEYTGTYLEEWLLAFLDGKYGDVPANVFLGIAGRGMLDWNRWAPHEWMVARVPLSVFTEEEARDYLVRRGVTDASVQEVILRLSGRLPLLVATLAVGTPRDALGVGDPTDTAVDRFLKWIPEGEQRAVAAVGALPRVLDRDALALLVGKETATAHFAWLCEMPFVESRPKGWLYHSVVREQLLRHVRRVSPHEEWPRLHGALAGYFEKLGDDLGLSGQAALLDSDWQELAMEAMYHRLCWLGRRGIVLALEGYIAAFAAQPGFAQRWAEAMAQAAGDSGVPELRTWGQTLGECARAHGEQRFADTLEPFALLCDVDALGARSRARVMHWRGEALRRSGRDVEALAEFDRSLALRPDNARTLRSRGHVSWMLGRHEEALADLDRAVALDPDDGWIIAVRGGIHWQAGRYEEALADLDRAVVLVPDNAWMLQMRAEVYRKQGRHEEALTDLDRALALDQRNVMGQVARAEVFRDLGRHEEALGELDRAVALAPDNTWALELRARVCGYLGRYEEALTDLDRAAALDPDNAWVLDLRARTYLDMGRDEEALADLGRALALDPEYRLALAVRAIVYRDRGQYEEALADLDRFVARYPDDGWALAIRGEINSLLERHEDALGEGGE